LNRLATFVATWGYSGLIRPAPGTWGTVAGMPFAWALLHWGNWTTTLVAILLAVVIGFWAARRHMATTQNPDDPSEIVVDEVAGLWVACLALPDANLWWLLAAFFLFRLFDVWKPGPVGWADRRLKGAAGVMADDLVAGAMAGIVLLAAMRLLEVL